MYKKNKNVASHTLKVNELPKHMGKLTTYGYSGNSYIVGHAANGSGSKKIANVSLETEEGVLNAYEFWVDNGGNNESLV